MLRLHTSHFDSGTEVSLIKSARVSIGRDGRKGSIAEQKRANAANRASLAMQLAPSAQTAQSIEAVLSLIPENVPPGVNIMANIEEARTMSTAQFYEAVRNGGKWDYKQLGGQYQEFGNWHFGVVAKAARIPESVARAGAGFAQMRAGTSPTKQRADMTVLFTDMSFGDDPPDQEAIGRGFKSYDLLGRDLTKELGSGKDSVKESKSSSEKIRVKEPVSDKTTTLSPFNKPN